MHWDNWTSRLNRPVKLLHACHSGIDFSLWFSKNPLVHSVLCPSRCLSLSKLLMWQKSKCVVVNLAFQTKHPTRGSSQRVAENRCNEEKRHSIHLNKYNKKTPAITSTWGKVISDTDFLNGFTVNTELNEANKKSHWDLLLALHQQVTSMGLIYGEKIESYIEQLSLFASKI